MVDAFCHIPCSQKGPPLFPKRGRMLIARRLPLIRVDSFNLQSLKLSANIRSWNSWKMKLVLSAMISWSKRVSECSVEMLHYFFVCRSLSWSLVKINCRWQHMVMDKVWFELVLWSSCCLGPIWHQGSLVGFQMWFADGSTQEIQFYGPLFSATATSARKHFCNKETSCGKTRHGFFEESKAHKEAEDRGSIWAVNWGFWGFWGGLLPTGLLGCRLSVLVLGCWLFTGFFCCNVFFWPWCNTVEQKNNSSHPRNSEWNSVGMGLGLPVRGIGTCSLVTQILLRNHRTPPPSYT